MVFEHERKFPGDYLVEIYMSEINRMKVKACALGLFVGASGMFAVCLGLGLYYQ